ncbi:prolipoprotein diacylglyceryl transferase [Candidatus Omnitrophota bacterium]
MHPVICKFGPLTVYSYGLSLVLAFGIATFLIMRQARKQGQSPELFFDLTFIILASGIIGARILYVALNPQPYLKEPLQIIMLNRGGLAWFGGLISGSLCSVFYLRRKGLDIYKVFDLAVPYVALAQAIGRVGCLLNGCCYGKESWHFGLYFPVHQAMLIPTQLYSSLALLGIYIILRLCQLRVCRRGQIFYLYLFLYASWRFFIEFFRADGQAFIFGMTTFQIFSIALFLLSSVMLIKICRNSP